MTSRTDAEAQTPEDFVLQAITITCNLEPSTVRTDTDIASLGIDSMGLTAIAAHLEVACTVEFTEEQALELYQAKLVSDIIALMRNVQCRS